MYIRVQRRIQDKSSKTFISADRQRNRGEKLLWDFLTSLFGFVQIHIRYPIWPQEAAVGHQLLCSCELKWHLSSIALRCDQLIMSQQRHAEWKWYVSVREAEGDHIFQVLFPVIQHQIKWRWTCFLIMAEWKAWHCGRSSYIYICGFLEQSEG